MLNIFQKIKAKHGEVFGCAMRIGNYKYLKEDGKESELYDLLNDTRESNNLLRNGQSDDESRFIKEVMARKNKLFTKHE